MKATEKWPSIAMFTIHLTCVDPDGDTITVTNDSELLLALEEGVKFFELCRKALKDKNAGSLKLVDSMAQLASCDPKFEIQKGPEIKSKASKCHRRKHRGRTKLGKLRCTSCLKCGKHCECIEKLMIELSPKQFKLHKCLSCQEKKTLKRKHRRRKRRDSQHRDEEKELRIPGSRMKLFLLSLLSKDENVKEIEEFIHVLLKCKGPSDVDKLLGDLSNFKNIRNSVLVQKTCVEVQMYKRYLWQFGRWIKILLQRTDPEFLGSVLLRAIANLPDLKIDLPHLVHGYLQKKAFEVQHKAKQDCRICDKTTSHKCAGCHKTLGREFSYCYYCKNYNVCKRCRDKVQHHNAHFFLNIRPNGAVSRKKARRLMKEFIQHVEMKEGNSPLDCSIAKEKFSSILLLADVTLDELYFAADSLASETKFSTFEEFLIARAPRLIVPRNTEVLPLFAWIEIEIETYIVAAYKILKGFGCVENIFAKRQKSSFHFFGYLQRLRKHGEKKFSCELCDKKFSDSTNLQRHERTHLK